MQPSRITIAADHPAFSGHFPGRPVLPGVALLAEVIEAALDMPALAAHIGAAPRLGVVKFLAPVLPGATLDVSYQIVSTRLRFEVCAADAGAARMASGEFEPPAAP